MTIETTTETDDRRKSFRRRTLLSGTVIFHANGSTYSCRIRNLGDDGARLIFDGVPLLPNHFDLLVDARGPHDTLRHVRRVWGNATDMGVAFV